MFNFRPLVITGLTVLALSSAFNLLTPTKQLRQEHLVVVQTM